MCCLLYTIKHDKIFSKGSHSFPSKMESSANTATVNFTQHYTKYMHVNLPLWLPYSSFKPCVPYHANIAFTLVSSTYSNYPVTINESLLNKLEKNLRNTHPSQYHPPIHNSETSSIILPHVFLCLPLQDLTPNHVWSTYPQALLLVYSTILTLSLQSFNVSNSLKCQYPFNVSISPLSALLHVSMPKNYFYFPQNGL